MQHYISVPQLIELCEEYDKKNGSYPENEYEGRAFLDFVFNKLSPDFGEVAVAPDHNC